jgi:hypothetical protein
MLHLFSIRDTRRGFLQYTESDLYDGPLLPFEYFQQSVPVHEDSQQRYKAYKSEYRRRKNREFFERHRGDPWFVDLYDPKLREKGYSSSLTSLKVRRAAFKARVVAEGPKVFSLALQVEERPSKREKSPDVKLRFTDDAEEEEDVENDEGSVLSDAGTKRAEEEEKPKKESESDEKEETDHQPEHEREKQHGMVFLQNISSLVSISVLHDLFKDEKGFIGLSADKPRIDRQYYRLMWAVYESMEDAEAAHEKVKDVHVHENIYVWRPMVQEPRHMGSHVVSRAFGEPRRIEMDVENVLKLIEKMDGDLGQREIDSDRMKGFLDVVGTEWTVVEKLDMLIHYLWEVHLFSYYDLTRYKTVADRIRRRPSLPLRPLISSGGRGRRDDSLSSFDEKLRSLFDVRNRFYVNPLEYYFSEIGRPFAKKIKEDLYFCPISEKRFKALMYVGKHVLNKYKEKVDEEFSSERVRGIMDENMWQLYCHDRDAVVPPIIEHAPVKAGAMFGRMGGPTSQTAGGGMAFDSRALVKYQDVEAPQTLPIPDFIAASYV